MCGVGCCAVGFARGCRVWGFLCGVGCCAVGFAREWLVWGFLCGVDRCAVDFARERRVRTRSEPSGRAFRSGPERPTKEW